MTAPGYWMHETSGVLRPAVEAYLRGETMTPEQIATMRAYLRQWIMAPAWDENPFSTGHDLAELRKRIDWLTTQGAIDAWLRDAELFGVDPL